MTVQLPFTEHFFFPYHIYLGSFIVEKYGGIEFSVNNKYGHNDSLICRNNTQEYVVMKASYKKYFIIQEFECTYTPARTFLT